MPWGICSFSPVAGIQWVETSKLERLKRDGSCFSPVAGIQWVETHDWNFTASFKGNVSVPLPGFSGLRLLVLRSVTGAIVPCFSPVAGIQWVETPSPPLHPVTVSCFSPVAGIQWVETCIECSKRCS